MYCGTDVPRETMNCPTILAVSAGFVGQRQGYQKETINGSRLSISLEGKEEK